MLISLLLLKCTAVEVPLFLLFLPQLLLIVCELNKGKPAELLRLQTGSQSGDFLFCGNWWWSGGASVWRPASLWRSPIIYIDDKEDLRFAEITAATAAATLVQWQAQWTNEAKDWRRKRNGWLGLATTCVCRHNRPPSEISILKCTHSRPVKLPLTFLVVHFLVNLQPHCYSHCRVIHNHNAVDVAEGSVFGVIAGICTVARYQELIWLWSSSPLCAVSNTADYCHYHCTDCLHCRA